MTIEERTETATEGHEARSQSVELPAHRSPEGRIGDPEDRNKTLN